MCRYATIIYRGSRHLQREYCSVARNYGELPPAPLSLAYHHQYHHQYHTTHTPMLPYHRYRLLPEAELASHSRLLPEAELPSHSRLLPAASCSYRRTYRGCRLPDLTC